MHLRNSAELPHEDFELAWYVARTAVFGNRLYPPIDYIWIRNSSSGYLSGHIKYNKKEIVISLPKDSYFPSIEGLGVTAPLYCVTNRLEAITAVLAHELKHLHTYFKHEKTIKMELDKNLPEILPLSERPHSEIACEKSAVIALNKLRAANLELSSKGRLNLLKLNDRLWRKNKIKLFNWSTSDFVTLQDLEAAKC